jgi:predicted ATPase with chaperone activity
MQGHCESEREFKKIRSVPNLYRRTVSGKYYLLVKRNGRQFRRSLKTNDFELNLSASAYDRILKVSGIIADLEGKTDI